MKVSKHKPRQVENNSLVRRHWRDQSVKNLLVDALHKFFAVVRIKVKQFFTINEQLDIVRGVEQLETPPEAYLAFLMPMALSRLTRDLSVKWERGRTDEKNTAKELLTLPKAVKIRIRERYRCLDFSTRVAAIDGQENARMHNVLRESPNLELSEISQNQHRIRKTGNCWVTGIVPCMLDEKSLAEYEPHGWQPPARGCFVKAGSRTTVSCFLDSSFQRSCVSIGVEDAINVEGLIKTIFVASFARVCRKSKKARCVKFLISSVNDKSGIKHLVEALCLSKLVYDSTPRSQKYALLCLRLYASILIINPAASQDAFNLGTSNLNIAVHSEKRARYVILCC
ncbi:hypothetical protein T4C_1340 [Trichinella pseudospiralis]|uniref:Uncharacterized protein n=1 Tax=Trichinella pseudospiralis TaxID=6337 RepID=A0A0V1K3A2_TRIPS|nr:hypothetical protein T4C_1340 [Trichinella pseudospiralis]